MGKAWGLIRTFFSEHIRISNVLTGVCTALIVGLITGQGGYLIGYKAGIDKGHDKGYEAGHTAGIEKGFLETEEIRKKLKTEHESEISKLKQEKIKELEESLKQRESEFEFRIQEMVEEKYHSELILAKNNGYDEGEKAGYERGKEEVKYTCRYKCDERLNEAVTMGILWQEFVVNIKQYANKSTRPKTEDGMVSMARSIVGISKIGRKSLGHLSDQLNGIVDEIKEALDKDNLEEVNRLMIALEGTLTAKEKVWRYNYQNIVLFNGEEESISYGM